MSQTISKEILELFEKMEYNEVPSINVNEAIEKLVKSHPVRQDETITFNDDRELAARLFEIAAMVEKDREKLNAIFAKRAPVANENPAEDIDRLISLSRYYAMLISQNKLWYQVNIDGGTWPENAVSSIYYTLSSIIQNSHIQMYLKYISFGPRVVLGGQSSIDTGMIVLADADLCAVMNALTAERVRQTDYLDRPLWYLKKIWVQEAIKEKFMKMIDDFKGKEDTCSIKSMLQGFRNKTEAIKFLDKEVHVKAFSIWTQDVVVAKNMAKEADKVFLIWINCYGEMGPGVSLPWSDVKHHHISSIPQTLSGPLKSRADGKKVVDLFYGGMWKEPINEAYREHSDGVLRACASQEDVEKCIASAESAFQKWRFLPLSQRQKCAYRLANRIQSEGDAQLALRMRVWAESPSLYNSSASRFRDDEVELVTTREPKGVILLTSAVRESLFRRITCACVTGNVVIVANGTPTADLEGIEKYCDMFATCGFPPGVISLLSFDDLGAAVINLSQLRSVVMTCTDHTPELLTPKKYWIDTENESESLLEKLCTKYTRPKFVWLPLK